MLPAGFELKTSAGERPQTYALDCAATGTGSFLFTASVIIVSVEHCLRLLKVCDQTKTCYRVA
jgi:hypothetical protein